MGTKKKINNCDDLNITCNNVKIEAKKEIKYLGATLDQSLSGESMYDNVLKKANRTLKFLYRKANFLKSRERKMMCNTMLQSHFDYACNVWYRSLGKIQKNKLQIVQNKMVRYILCKDNRYHVDTDNLNELKMLNVNDRVDFLTLNTMYKIVNETAPPYLCDMYLTCDRHNYNTRFANLSYQVPTVQTNGRTTNTFKYNAINLWNDLPNNVKKSINIDVFKRSVKEHLFTEARKRDNDEFVWYQNI